MCKILKQNANKADFKSKPLNITLIKQTVLNIKQSYINLDYNIRP